MEARANRRVRTVIILIVLSACVIGAPASAHEMWVAPIPQQDLGGVGTGSNFVWPVSPAGAARFVLAVPNDLETFQRARVVLIPDLPGGAKTLNAWLCIAAHADAANAACAGPFPQPILAVANQLVEVDISAVIAPAIGDAGARYIAVLVSTTPNTSSDHVVGLRFAYDPVVPAGVATLGANAFGSTQIAPLFVGNFLGNGAGLTNVAKLTANIFNGTQTINGGDLALHEAAEITKGGAAFVHTNGGINNTYLGVDAGAMPGFGFGNTGIGRQALMVNGGTHNTAVGAFALSMNRTEGFNTAVGESALRENLSGFNTAVGRAALATSVNGHHNTAVGLGALISLSSGSGNIAIGESAGGSTNSGNGNLYIAHLGVDSESDTIRIGRLHTRTFITGIRGVTTANGDAIPVVIDSAGQLGTVSSSRRYKEDIRDMADASDRLTELRPVTFKYRQESLDGTKPLQFGLVAEEVAEVFPELAVRNADGEPETVHYEKLSVLLLNELQKQHRRIDALDRQLGDLLKRFGAPRH